MSSQGVATTVVYLAYNPGSGVFVTGDVANHTIRLVKDGTEASPINSPSEVDSTNAPGAYKLALTAAETQFGTVWIGGKSSTAGVIIIPITLTFEILPTALDANGNVQANTNAVGASPTAAQNVSKANQTIGRGTAAGGGTTSSIPTSSWSLGGAGVISGQFALRTLIFDSNTTTLALQGQAATISGNTSGANPTITLQNALTNVPAAGDTFGVY